MVNKNDDLTILNEGPIVVNKFKKTMTLYHAALEPKVIIKPYHPSAGNKLERQSGPATFFFADKEYAERYVIGKASGAAFREFCSKEKEYIAKNFDMTQQSLIRSYLDFINKSCDNYFPPLYNALNKNVDLYCIDDSKLYPRYPFCKKFIDYLTNIKYKVYVLECEVETSKIKHGHSKDFTEFTVFEDVPVKAIHEYSVAGLMKKHKITKLTTYEQIKQYTSKYIDGIDKFGIKHKRDIFRSLITYDDIGKRIKTYINNESENLSKLNLYNECLFLNEDILK